MTAKTATFYGWTISNGYPDYSFIISCSKCGHRIGYSENALDPKDIPRICPRCNENLVPNSDKEANQN